MTERQLSRLVGEVRPEYLGHTVHELFEAQVSRTPEAVAVQTSSETLTYRELNERANRLARSLLPSIRTPETRIGLFVERSPEMLVGMLATMKAGGCYVPLEPALPDERLVGMARRAGADLVLVQSHYFSRAKTIFRNTENIVDIGLSAQRDVDAENLNRALSPGTLAYVMFTSGSTGLPKGTMVEHRSVVNRLLWMNDAGLVRSDDRVLQRTPYAFDASVWEIFCPLIAGARLCFADRDGHRDPAYHIAAIRTWGITVLQTVPSFLALLLTEEEVGACQSLKRVFFGGEKAA